MILITSGGYVEQELRSEFGFIPPVFLPIGNRPLLALQAAELQRTFPEQDIVLSLPDDYELTNSNLELIKANGIEIVRVPNGLTLCDSVLYCLNLCARYSEPVRVLHGDTYINNLPDGADLLLVAESSDEYEWHRRSERSQDVWCGYFAFRSTVELIKQLVVSKTFEEAVERYSNGNSLDYIRALDWADCGHLNTYYDARKSFTTERAFNSLRIENGVVYKRGEPPAKIESEWNWFRFLPIEIKPFAPALYAGYTANSKFEYAIEYLPQVPLNELFVHGRQQEYFWQYILGLYNEWFEKARSGVFQVSNSKSDVQKSRQNLIVDKTVKRITALEESEVFDLDIEFKINGALSPSIREIAEKCMELCSMAKGIGGLLHGDLCFSNAIHDRRNRRLRFIDPRGAAQPEEVIGDLRYDLAKLGHSVVGLYDYIIAGHYNLVQRGTVDWILDVHQDSITEAAGQSFLEFSFSSLDGLYGREVMPEVVLLFISMTPLHFDDPYRQRALLLNAARLYTVHLRKEGL